MVFRQREIIHSICLPPPYHSNIVHCSLQMVLTSRYLMNLRETNAAQSDTEDDRSWDTQDSVFANDFAFERGGDIWTVNSLPFDTQPSTPTWNSGYSETSSLPSPQGSGLMTIKVRMAHDVCHATELTETACFRFEPIRLALTQRHPSWCRTDIRVFCGGCRTPGVSVCSIS